VTYKKKKTYKHCSFKFYVGGLVMISYMSNPYTSSDELS